MSITFGTTLSEITGFAFACGHENGLTAHRFETYDEAGRVLQAEYDTHGYTGGLAVCGDVEYCAYGMMSIQAIESDPSPDGPFLRPVVLRVIKYVKMSWRTRTTCTKEAVKRRDGRCAYCTKGKAETVDHIMPQSRGGLNTWLNLVGCCFKCNQRKADRTPEEAGMKLLLTPYAPKARPPLLPDFDYELIA
ncbi:HNH endonuclease [Arthrobacter sp. SLBN-100]|uniref:HNH endonuclease n=1 Tax=Arthrobacter sp. SLBN-100 TaxID=2768450 RepID=UPI00116CEE23|nr:HNH endonuclease [Arthrobacter sp. SLBN-100]TQJ66557.1 HNH endonuclease [Arthrobacter sp. SLBN-100]